MTHDPFHSSSDDLEERLRRALQEEAQAIRPAGDGLNKIRATVEDRRSFAWWKPAVLAVAAAGGAGLIAGLVLLGGDDDGENAVANPTTLSNSASEPGGRSETGGDSTGEPGSTSAAGTAGSTQGSGTGEPPAAGSTGEGTGTGGTGEPGETGGPGETPGSGGSTAPDGTASSGGTGGPGGTAGPGTAGSGGTGDPSGDGAIAGPTPTQSDSGSGSPPAAEAVTVPVYYLGDDQGQLRLYREFHREPLVEGSEAVTALTRMFENDAVDPDYTSVWPADTEVLSYDVADGIATVDLSAEALGATNAGSDAEAKSVQQLVHTVTGAEPTVRAVRLLVEGQEVTDLWGAGAVGPQPITRAASYDVLALVWVTTPVEGATVGGTLEFGGVATAFEATVNWQVLDGATVVADGFATADAGAPARGEWSDSVTLAPGTYVLRAFIGDASGGESGQPEPQDTKTFTVR